MKVSHQRLEGNQVELKVEVEVEKVADALDKAYKKVVKEVKVPGFRKGRVPRKVLEARFGVEVLYNDALDILLPEAYSQAVEEIGIEPIDRPVIEDVHIEAGKPFTFTAKVLVKPEVKLGQYTGLGLEQEEVKVDEEDVNRELELLQQRHTQLKTTDRDVVEKGDYAIIDFEGFIDGEPFEGGSGEEYALEIGSNTFIEGFEEQLIGAKVGEEVEVNVTFPEDYRAEHLAGKPATFKVTVKEIKVKDVPELNDDFAKEVSEFETLEELKEDIRKKLLENAKEQARREFENKVVDTVAQNAEIDIPEKMIDDELERMYQTMAFDFQQHGIPFDKYLEYVGSSVDKWKEENRAEAEKRVRASLTLEAIAEKEGIVVTDEEIDNRIAELAEKNNQDPKKFKQFLLLQGNLDNLSYGMTMEKVIDFLVEKNAK
ncbi:trigger factor [Anoxybacter fermentans]|uniref:Trigger factor n=1 Tax=Anoxybacter fermentans TaxID=1323375 RepID=A0A3S9SYG2_9FIRM|nr:trigger factor [Anoxybacter fermentans]AZR73383.1 trigger factor [Anoxybacter fermentans]